MTTPEPEETGPTLGQLIARVAARHDLTVDEAEIAFATIMEGRATPVQIAAFLAALRTKGETPAEVAGGVRAMRAAMVPVPVAHGEMVVDTCGTGGGALTTFNISTAAALVAAGAGVRIAKHGNRSFTSRCGSADVLGALDVVIELSPEGMAEVFERAGIVFMFAPLLHPAMRHVGPVRRELGMPTIMNLLGPLTNPAGARRQVVGVSHPELLELIAGALQTLGHARALVVHGEPGLDELSPIGPTDVVELKDGALTRSTIDPSSFGWSHAEPDELAGGDPAQNARVVVDILSGDRSGAAILFGNLGNIHSAQGDYGKALEYYQKGLKIKEELGDKGGIAMMRYSIGNVCFNTGDYTKALEHYRESLALHEACGDRIGVAFSTEGLGNIYYSTGEYSKALIHYEKGLRIREDLGDKSGIALVLGNIGNIYASTDDYEKALGYHNRSLAIKKELGDLGKLHAPAQASRAVGAQEKARQFCREQGMLLNIFRGRLKQAYIEYIARKR